jgi:hypothetical protein
MLGYRTSATCGVITLACVAVGCVSGRQRLDYERMPSESDIEPIPMYGLLTAGVFGTVEFARGFPIEAYTKACVIIGEDRDGYIVRKIDNVQTLAGNVRVANEREALRFVRQ